MKNVGEAKRILGVDIIRKDRKKELY